MMAYESNFVVILISIIYNALSTNKNYNLQRQPWSLEFKAAQQEVYIIYSSQGVTNTPSQSSTLPRYRFLNLEQMQFFLWFPLDTLKVT